MIRQRNLYLGSGQKANFSLVNSSKCRFDKYTVLHFADFDIFTIYHNPDCGVEDFASMTATQAFECLNDALSNEPLVRYFRGDMGITMVLPLN